MANRYVAVAQGAQLVEERPARDDGRRTARRHGSDDDYEGADRVLEEQSKGYLSGWRGDHANG